MGVSTNGILVYGLSFDEGELNHSKLAKFLGYESPQGEADDADDDEDAGADADCERSEAVDKLLKQQGLSLTWHCSYDFPMFIIGCGEVTARRGYPEAVEDLPRPSEQQAEALLNLKNKFGGKLGVWLCSMWG